MNEARTVFRVFAALGALLLLNGCATPPPPESMKPAFDPAQFSGGEVYDVSPGDSQLIIRVYRSGPMAQLGHNHVISTTDLRGAIYRHDDLDRSGLVLTIPVQSLQVDDADLRDDDPETFDTVPTEKDVAGTRRNMLSDKLLDAENYPVLSVRSVSISGSAPTYEASLRFRVKDHHYDARVPLNLQTRGEQIVVQGETTLLQSDLGLEPYSVMMGALQVQDELEIRFHIVANKRGR